MLYNSSYDSQIRKGVTEIYDKMYRLQRIDINTYMFNKTKYTKWYYLIIQKYADNSKCRKGFEKHHIIPKSLGGDNKQTNIALIPSRVHFILHKLLIKMVEDTNLKWKMKYALWRMLNPQSKYHTRGYIVTAHDYQKMRESIQKAMTQNNPMKLEHNRQRMRDNNPMHRVEVVSKFKGKNRPEQSIVCTERNNVYWADPTNKAKFSQYKRDNKEKYNKWWKVENVITGEEWIVLGLHDFCIEHNLKQPGLSNAMKENRLYKKAWKITPTLSTVLLTGG